MSRPANLDDKVREALRQQILSGELSGGAHLSELKISKQYDVSRTPVREALCALAADGLVEMVPHRGAFVTTPPAHVQMDQQYCYALFWGMAGRMAAEKASIDMLMEAEQAFAFASDTTLNASAFSKAVTHANNTLLAIANSPTISESLAAVERRSTLGTLFSSAVGVQKELQQHYALLLGALKRKKADTAEKTMRQIVLTALEAQTGKDSDALITAMLASTQTGEATSQQQRAGQAH